MRSARPLCLPLVVTLSFALTVLAVPSLPASRAAVLAQSAATRGASVRVVGPNAEPVPVLNEGGASLKLHVEDATHATVAANGWRSGSADVATVDNTGMVRPVKTGFATVYAETSLGVAKCFVAVMRVRAQTGGMAQGDTKSDSSGKLYLSDPVHHVIVRATGTTTERWVGASDQPAFRDGAGAEARFDEPTGLGVDLSTDGGLYVADTLNHCIRKVGFDGRAGSQRRSSVVVGQAEASGVMSGGGPFALEDMRLSGPRGVVSVGGSLYIADTDNHCIWFADAQKRKVWLVAGEPGAAGLEDGQGRAARLSSPSGLAINTRGNLLAVADTGNDVVRLVRLEATDDGGRVGEVRTLGVASSGKWTDAEKAATLDDLRDAIAFDAPTSVSVDGAENVYVIDARTASVVTRPEESMPVVVGLAADGTLGRAVSLTVEGPRALVLDGAAERVAESVREVTVGKPEIATVSPEAVGLEGGEEVVIEGQNFAPESEVTFGGEVVSDYEVESATRIRLRAPAVRAPGARTLTVLTRGGAAQAPLNAASRGLAELALGDITTVAGGVAYIGDGGLAVSASFDEPSRPAVDGAGNVFIADRRNGRIRRVDGETGRITTVAGSGNTGYDGDEKPATSASLNLPSGVAVDGSGTLFVADTFNNRIRRVDGETGRITTVAGTGERGYNGDKRAATSASLDTPYGVAVDGAGNLFIADTGNRRIRRVDGETGRITTVAGTGEYAYDGDEKPATSASLRAPNGVAVDGAGTLYIADTDNNRIRRVDAETGRITTVAGTGTRGYDGDEKPATSARLSAPVGVAVDGSGDIFISDGNNQRIRRVDGGTGQITTVAGTGVQGYDGDDKPATSARIGAPNGVAVHALGDLFIATISDNRIRRVDGETGQITTLAGTSRYGYDGDDKPATLASLRAPNGVAVDGAGNLFIADTPNNRIRRVDAETGLIATVAGTGEYGYDGDDKPATSARLGVPYGVTVDGAGNLYIADTLNSRIRRVDGGTGQITTVAGTGVQGYDGDDKPATSARLGVPYGVAVDGAGTLFIADTANDRIRRVDAETGRITTVAGTGVQGYDGDDKPATSAMVNGATGVAVDGAGNLYIADTDNNRIRRVDGETGRITTVAGTGVPGYNGDEMPATSAWVAYPTGVTVDGAGNLLVADTVNSRIRRVDGETGRITTVAGTGEYAYDGDEKPALSAKLAAPNGVAIDGSGNLFVADGDSNAIRAVKGPLPGGGPGDGPRIDRARFTSAKGRLQINGGGFGSTGAVVTINGVDVGASIRKQTDRKLLLRGSLDDLGLRPGANEIVVTVAGRASNTYVLNL